MEDPLVDGRIGKVRVKGEEEKEVRTERAEEQIHSQYI